MPTRTAVTRWSGDLPTGSGQVEFASSGVATFDVSFPRRAADTAEGVTSPEELLAASHSSCFSMALSNGLATAGGTVDSLVVTASVTLGPDPAGGFRLTGIVIDVDARVSGLDDDVVRAKIDEAKAGCPISKALATVDISIGKVTTS
jgi:osmotically inducible protein OsmC